MKNIIILIFTLLSTILLTACERYTVESSSFKEYKIVDIKRPKHFRVSLKDQTGRIFENINVSKHCNRWREVQLDSKVSLKTLVMTNSAGTDR